MTRSVFDPGGDDVLREGGRYGSQPGGAKSKMPPDLVDGEVDAEEAAEGETIEGVGADDGDLVVIDDEVQSPFNSDAASAADSLAHIEVDDEGQVETDDEPRQME